MTRKDVNTIKQALALLRSGRIDAAERLLFRFLLNRGHQADPPKPFFTTRGLEAKPPAN